MPATSQLVIPVKTGNQEYDLDSGFRRGDEAIFDMLLVIHQSDFSLRAELVGEG